MKLEQRTLPVQNELLAHYWSEEAAIHSFFDYRYNDAAFSERANYLNSKSYNTEQLSAVIRSYMAPFGISNAAEEHLAELAAGAHVVVGGQQAGVFTGPMYSVHKAISVIVLAKEQREKLGQPVVPLFWIAGEDHDLEEINHTFTIVEGMVKKRGYGERSKRKTMASTTPLNQAEMERLVHTVFADFGETAYTKELLNNVLSHLRNSKTFTAFFTALMNDLFAKHGLLMVDSAYTPFRQYEKEYFKAIIENNEEIARVVVEKEGQLNSAGYGTPIEATVSNANLFFVQDGERFLLERKGDYYSNVLGHIKMTQEELLLVAENSPECLSNNVVTRPLMQEMTIPVLAFVGGPGELAYWATLKGAFDVLQLQMPIFAPRLNISLVTRAMDPLLKQYDLSFEDVTAGKVEELKDLFVDSVQDLEAQRQIDVMQEILIDQLDKLEQHLQQTQLALHNVIEKNQQYHVLQFDYLRKKLAQQVLVKHEVALRQFNLLSAELYPNNGFQERVYNPYQYINQYGPSLVDDLLELELVPSNYHNIVLL
ncbi:bacillithiol biosynthesis cysteine-adding enzyme BshC [Solibacillus sp. CAU 1738]|uniref:bacillithiol biosynthesis cysteine-adding enzyme BshC n=1 Tax=Solibacillus sp. CAU 1738 TaxID=3140363 RepID=UPI0032600732